MEVYSRVMCRHPTCNRSFESLDSMNQHYSVCHPENKNQQLSGRYACELCSKSRFKTKGGLEDHMRIVHCIVMLASDQPQQDQGRCAMFSSSTVGPPLLQPDQLDLINNVACNDCGKATFKNTDALHQHQWASAGHTRVSKSPNPNNGTRERTCSQCHRKLPSPEDLEQHFVEEHPISELPMFGEERVWQTVADRFRAAWIKPTIKLHVVHRIFKVYNPGWRRRDFEEYRKQVKKQMSNQKLMMEENFDLRNRILYDGNELLRYHGTTMSCMLGRLPAPPSSRPSRDQGVTSGGETLSLCSDGDCSLCRILQTGFQKSKCRVTKFQRFGKGIYCSSASSKASAYVKCSSSGQESSLGSWLLSYFWGDGTASVSGKGNYKVMMVCRVIAGRPHHTTSNLQSLKCPPPGYHSVQGDPGEALNYDELVVYDDCAILPAYIILYTSSD